VEKAAIYAEPGGRVYSQARDPGDAVLEETLVRFNVYRGNPVDKPIIDVVRVSYERALAESFAVGFLVTLTIFVVGLWAAPRPSGFVRAASFAMLLVVTTVCAYREYFAGGALRTPYVEGLTRAGAERLLWSEGFVPAVRLEDVGENVSEVDHVLRDPAQSPRPGLLVPRKTVVRFSVGIRSQVQSSSGNAPAWIEPCRPNAR